MANTGGSSVFAKAQEDPFRYACRLRTGESFSFEYAVITGEWAHFTQCRDMTGFPEPMLQTNPKLDRGLDVRVSEIIWMLDSTS